MNRAEWDAHFRNLAAQGAELALSPDPAVADLVTRFAPAREPRRALDLACGAGGNALWLAAEGWQVTAVDRSPAAIDLLRTQAGRRGVNIDARIADLEADEYAIAPGSWDLILVCRYLQRDLFEPALRGLAPGGILIVVALLADAGTSGTAQFRVKPGELAASFSGSMDWTIAHQREVLSPGSPRGHSMAEIVVRRD